MENYEKCWLHYFTCKSREDPESSRIPTAPGKLGAMFSSGNKEPGNQFKSFICKHADPSNLGRCLLEDNEDHLHQFGSLNNCISELQQQVHAQR